MNFREVRRNFTAKQVARMAKVSERTVTRWCRAGILTARCCDRINGHWKWVINGSPNGILRRVNR